MKYTTNDLSKILNVSTNTIRRYEEKGFLHATRNESNGYREFDNIDIEKLMYTNKYRKIGFSQENITAIFEEDVSRRRERFLEKMDEIDAEMKRLNAVRHMVKDDLELLKRIDDFSDEIKPFPSSPMHCVLYQEKGNVSLGKERAAAIHTFLETCPEYEYIYLFEKEDVINERLIYSEGIAANKKVTDKYNVCVDPPVVYYPSKQCIMKVVRVPLDLTDEQLMSQDEVCDTLFGQFGRYMKENGQKLDGGVLGVKLGMFRENDNDWQYVLMHVPVTAS